MSDRKENIVYFVADQMRSDSLHHLGNLASKTPNLDQLSREGVSFRNAYCQNPVCVPSRCSFLTGLMPHTTGHRTMHFLQNADEPNILREMKNNGYEVIWVGRNDIVPGDREKIDYCDMFFDGSHEEDMKASTEGWHPGGRIQTVKPMEKLDPEDDRYYSFYIGELTKESAQEDFDWHCVRSALNYLEHRTGDKPFFLYLTLSYPHPPYMCEDPWFSSIDRNGLMPRRPDLSKTSGKPSMLHGIHSKQHMEYWSEERWNELRATYLAMVCRFDYHFGVIRDKVKEIGVYDDTNIFVFSDHGDYTGDYGIVEKVQNCFDDPIVNVPLIIKPAKGREVQPRISDQLVALSDLCATISQIGGFSLSYKQFGISLLPLLTKEEPIHEAVFAEGGRVHGEPQAMEQGHGPKSPYWPRLSTQCLEGPEHTKAVMERSGDLKYVKRLYEDDELYDLSKDPMEKDNIIHDPAYASEVAKMQARMLDFMIATGDYVPNRKDKR